MREMVRHKEGKILITILSITLLLQLFVWPYLGYIKYLFLGFIPMLWFLSLVNLVIWAVALPIYLYKYWPYRNI
jgi:isoprenylcysteine carboxyl methyltransferase (ICMT) family protein YpbQ